MIAFVPPHSLAAVLEASAEVLGHDRRCVVARELTKMYEELYRSTLGNAAERYAGAAVRVRPQAARYCSSHHRVPSAARKP